MYGEQEGLGSGDTECGVILVQGARAGHQVACIAASWAAEGKVTAVIARAQPRHLPEGGYAFENVSKLDSCIVLIANGQV